MYGRIVQVSISPGGVPKRAVAESFIAPLGLEGDSHAHPQIHGGPAKAVLVICAEVLEELKAAGHPVFDGALGENLTVSGVDRRIFRSGQQWRAGEAIIEFTTLRAPCDAIAIYDLPGRPIANAIWDKKTKAGDPSSPVWAMAGFYASVVRPGLVWPGSTFALLDQAV
jgi:MOSC domain-containing protein YiiM